MMTIIIVILVIVSYLGITFYDNIQDQSSIIVSVETDKSTYSDSENVTFELSIDTHGKEFEYPSHSHESSIGSYYRNYGVFVYRISETVSPSEFVASYPDYGVLNVESASSVGFVSISEVSSDNCDLHLTWNKTIYNSYTGQYSIALAGQYCLIASMPDDANFIVVLDESNFFNIEGLEIEFSTNVDSSSYLVGNITITENIRNGLASSIDYNVIATAYFFGIDQVYSESNFTLNANESKSIYITSANRIDYSNEYSLYFSIDMNISSSEGNYYLHIYGQYGDGEWTYWY
ncbi:MAG: hypothetical protein WC375_03795 [Methanomassiliicoccales archaeon]